MNDIKENIKVVFLGESEVGKSALFNHYIYNTFDKFTPHYDGPAYFDIKKINYKNEDYHFEIWDISGNEKYRSFAKLYIKEAKIIALVYDITKKKTFLGLNVWLDLVLKELGQDIFLILIGNKLDLYENEEITEDEGKKFAEALGAKFFLSTVKYGNSYLNIPFENALIDYIKTLNK